jgi:hypothetical protein
MALTDRQAADIRANEAVAQAHQTLVRSIQANRNQPGLGFRNGLIEATRVLAVRSIEVYAVLEGASNPPLEDELIGTIHSRVKAFIQSSVAGQRGTNAAMAAREGANLIAAQSVGISTQFKLAVHEHAKQQAAPPRPGGSEVAPVATPTIDLAIVTILPEEYQAVLGCL